MTNGQRFWTATIAAALGLALLALAALAPAALAQSADSLADAQVAVRAAAQVAVQADAQPAAQADVQADAQDDAPTAPPNALALWLRDLLPPSIQAVRLLGLEMWQWLGLAFCAVAAVLVGYVVARLAAMIVRRFVRRTRATWDDAFLELGVGPLRLALVVLVFAFGARLLALAPSTRELLASACKMAGVLAVTWFGLRAIDIVNRILSRSTSARSQTAAMALLPIARRVAKLFVLIIAVISLLQNIGFNVTGLLAGLGVGGLALALAAQKTLENLFGGVGILADRTVKVGDLCTVGAHSGVVEEIGLRATRLRTLARTLVAIPNAELATARIENFAARDYTVMQTTLPLASDASPEQLHRVLAEIRSALEAHPMVAEYPRRVRLVHIGPNSYDIEVYAGIRTTSQEAFIQHREDVLLKIIDVVAACGARFAVAPQTLYAGAPPPAGIPGTERKP